jgi:hypothetical protein
LLRVETAVKVAMVAREAMAAGAAREVMEVEPSAASLQEVMAATEATAAMGAVVGAAVTVVCRPTFLSLYLRIRKI